MKQNSLTVLVGVLLLAIFALLLFTFQVRQTEIALVTTFDRPTRYITNSGFNVKWPPPIQRVIKFDKRIQLLDQDKIAEMITQDSFNLVLQVYVGWTISQPDVFFSSFPAGTVIAARPALEDLIQSAKSHVVGQHPFSQFVSTDPKELKFTQIENEMLEDIRPIALKNYGIDVRFLGIKKLSLPESVTAKVFERMNAERNKQKSKLEAEGLTAASSIRNSADSQRTRILAEAGAKATEIKGQADAIAAGSYAVFTQAPELANFIFELRALEEVGKDRTTWILDSRTSPFNLLTTNFWDRSTTNQMPNLVTNGLPGILEGKATASRTYP
jgi:membrane protease subunit HflC